MNQQNNREPWLAVSLSWFLPGSGHLYYGAYRRGISILVAAGSLYVLTLASLISIRTPILLSLLFCLLGTVALPIFACVNSFRTTKKSNTVDFEKQRALSKDPWLSVLLSCLVPGAGHAYLREGGFALLFFVVFAGLFPLSRRTNQWFLINTFFRVAVCAHSYAVCRIHRNTKRSGIVFFLLFLVSVQCLGHIVLPALSSRFVVDMDGVCVGTSMMPTLIDGDRVVVNKLAYRWSRPHVGDVVAFFAPSSDPNDERIIWGKRIVAVGSETVRMHGVTVHVDGQERRFATGVNYDIHPGTELALESFGHEDNPHLAYGSDEPYHVPAGQYFVLGDNRRHSVDSRSYGAIPIERIIGRVVKIYLPVRRMGAVN
jgi:signal peptidase I